VPAGTARLTDILWLDSRLFVSPLSKAKLAKRVPEEIGKSLSADIRAALAYAFERSADDIRDYLEENFTLGPEQVVAATVVEAQPSVVRSDDHGIGEADEDAHGDVAPVDRDDPDLPEADAPAVQDPEPPAKEPERELIETETATRPRPAPRPRAPASWRASR
jgi:hypothetical protein